MTLLEECLAANTAYVAGRPVIPPSAVPQKHLVVLTCMDVRIDPLPVLGLHLGDVHVLRNAGARVTEDVVRSLAVSQQVLETEAVIVMPHTRCGMLGLDPDVLLEKLAVSREALPPLDFRPIADLERDLLDDLQSLRNNPWISRRIQLYGILFEVETGAVRPVFPA